MSRYVVLLKAVFLNNSLKVVLLVRIGALKYSIDICFSLDVWMQGNLKIQIMSKRPICNFRLWYPGGNIHQFLNICNDFLSVNTGTITVIIPFYFDR